MMVQAVVELCERHERSALWRSRTGCARSGRGRRARRRQPTPIGSPQRTHELGVDYCGKAVVVVAAGGRLYLSNQ